MFLDRIPKISCITVSMGHLDFLKNSINCYLNQTYNNKELLILSQGTNSDKVKNYIDSLECDDIFFYQAPKNISLGQMRNVAIEMCGGEMVCQWDDDDLYHPKRIVTQYQKIMAEKSVGCFYSQFLKYFRNWDLMYWVDCSDGTEYYKEVVSLFPYKKFLCGSAMFWRKAFFDYDGNFYPEEGPQTDTEEDLNVLGKLLRLGKISEVKDGYHYIYTYHGLNTYSEKHHLAGLHKKKIFSKEELLAKKDKILETLDLVDLDIAVDVCFSEVFDYDEPDASLGKIPAFTYRPN